MIPGMGTRNKEVPNIVEDPSGNRFELRPRSCPICGVRAERTMGLRGGEYHRYGYGIVSRIVRCHRCGLLFPDPFPYPQDPQRLYGDPDEYFGRSDLEGKVESYRVLVREMAARLNRRAFSLLDVGAGRGELVAAARAEGVSAVGLEPSVAMIEQARERLGVELRRETIEEFGRSGDHNFDAISLCGVLEHVYDPNSLFASVRRLTHPRSICYIDVPREPNLLSLVGNAWNRLRGNAAVYNLQPTWPPYHVFGFNPGSLSALLAKHGFAIDSLLIYAVPEVPSRDEWKDRMRAFVAAQILRLGNYTGFAANMYAWASRRS